MVGTRSGGAQRTVAWGLFANAILLASSSALAEENQSARESASEESQQKRSLPFLGDVARKAGYELPLPYGVDLFTHFQRENLEFERVVLNGNDLTDALLAPGGSSARATTNLVAARADVWLLPFLNITLAAGYVYGLTSVKLALSDEVKDLLDFAGVQADDVLFNTDITGPMVSLLMFPLDGLRPLVRVTVRSPA